MSDNNSTKPSESSTSDNLKKAGGVLTLVGGLLAGLATIIGNKK